MVCIKIKIKKDQNQDQDRERSRKRTRDPERDILDCKVFKFCFVWIYLGGFSDREAKKFNLCITSLLTVMVTVVSSNLESCRSLLTRMASLFVEVRLPFKKSYIHNIANSLKEALNTHTQKRSINLISNKP